jgi:hypothetical protein
MKKRILMVLLVTGRLFFARGADSNLSDSTESNTGILYGTDHAFSLTAPSGWILDNQSGVSQGLHAVFYPRGNSWKYSPAVMYGKGESKDIKANQTVEEFIAHDSVQFIQNFPTVTIEQSPAIVTRHGKVAIVRKFIYSQNEIVAYFDEPKIVAMIVLTARSKGAFEDAYASFEQLVSSYLFMGDNHLEKTTSFAVAVKSADENLKSTEGEQYDDAVGRSCGSWLSTEVNKCVEGLADADLAPVTVLIRLGISGKAEELLAQPETKAIQCLESAFTAAIYPRPPGPSWWVKVNLTFTDE